MLGALFPLLILTVPLSFADPQHCYSYNECYNIGFRHGYADGQRNDTVILCHRYQDWER